MMALTPLERREVAREIAMRIHRLMPQGRFDYAVGHSQFGVNAWRMTKDKKRIRMDYTFNRDDILIVMEVTEVVNRDYRNAYERYAPVATVQFTDTRDLTWAIREFIVRANNPENIA